MEKPLNQHTILGKYFFKMVLFHEAYELQNLYNIYQKIFLDRQYCRELLNETILDFAAQRTRLCHRNIILASIQETV